MDYIVTIKFKNRNKAIPGNFNKVIELIPVAYKSGHTQVNIMKSMYPSKNYDINFRKNQEAAEKFRTSLFEKCGNDFDINCNYI